MTSSISIVDQPHLGDRVRDLDDNEGIVVVVDCNLDTIHVWQINRTNCGPDNCIQYNISDWRNTLKVIEPSAKKPMPNAEETWEKEYDMRRFWFNKLLEVWDVIPVRFRGDPFTQVTIVEKIHTMIKYIDELEKRINNQ